MKTITAVKAWMRAATPQERELMAAEVGTSVGMLQQYSGGHRDCSAERAGEIEAVSAKMHKASKGRLPKVVRTDLCAACRACPYAAKALGERALVSDFPILADEQVAA